MACNVAKGKSVRVKLPKPTEPAAEELAAELYKVAVMAASGRRRRLKLSSAGGLKELAQAAAEEVLSPHRFGPRSKQEAAFDLDVRIEHARAAFRALVYSMSDHARTIPRYSKDQLGERTLAHSMYGHKAGFCPCWPIC